MEAESISLAVSQEGLLINQVVLVIWSVLEAARNPKARGRHGTYRNV